MPRYKIRHPWYYQLPWYLLMAAAAWAGFRLGHNVLPQRQAASSADSGPPPASAAVLSPATKAAFGEMRDWLSGLNGKDSAALTGEWEAAEKAAAAAGASAQDRAKAELLLDALALQNPAAIHRRLAEAGQVTAARRVLQRWSARDGKAAFAHAAASEDPGDRAAAWLGIAGRRPEEAALLLDDPANDRILNLVAGQMPVGEFTALLGRLPPSNPAVKAALAATKSDEPVLEGEAARQRQRLEQSLQRNGMIGAATLALEMTPEAQAWLVRQIPADTLPQFVQDAISRSWQPLLPALVTRWAGFDPGAAEKFVENIPDQPALEGALWTGLMAGPPERLAERAAAPAGVPEAWLPQVVERLARTAPATAIQLFGKLPEAQRTEKLIALVVDHLAKDDPRTAGKWVLETLPEVRQALAMQKVAGPWVDADPRRAAEWISELPVSLARDHAIAELIRHFVQSGDLPSAALWADQISDSSLRETLEKQTRPADSPDAPAPAADSPAPAPAAPADAETPAPSAR